MDIWSNEIKVIVVDDKQQEHLIALKKSTATGSGNDSLYIFCSQKDVLNDDDYKRKGNKRKKSDIKGVYTENRHKYMSDGQNDIFDNNQSASSNTMILDKKQNIDRDWLKKYDSNEVYDTTFDDYDSYFIDHVLNNSYNVNPYNMNKLDMDEDNFIIHILSQDMPTGKIVDLLVDIANGTDNPENGYERYLRLQLENYLQEKGIEHIERIVRVVSIGGYRDGLEDFNLWILGWHDFRDMKKYREVANKYCTDAISLRNYQKLLDESILQCDIIIKKEYNPKDMTVHTTNKVLDEEIIGADNYKYM